jgi:hypothetical protein
MRDPDFKEGLNYTSARNRRNFWLNKLDPASVVWLLDIIRFAIDLEWLYRVISLEFDDEYSVEDWELSRDVLRMIWIRLVAAAEVAFIHMVDAFPTEGAMSFPIVDAGTLMFEERWKYVLEGLQKDSPTREVPVEQWPINTKVFDELALGGQE